MAATHPKNCWDRDQIKVKRLSKLDYPTIWKQCTMCRRISNSWGYHVWV